MYGSDENTVHVTRPRKDVEYLIAEFRRSRLSRRRPPSISEHIRRAPLDVDTRLQQVLTMRNSTSPIVPDNYHAGALSSIRSPALLLPSSRLTDEAIALMIHHHSTSSNVIDSVRQLSRALNPLRIPHVNADIAIRCRLHSRNARRRGGSASARARLQRCILRLVAFWTEHAIHLGTGQLCP